MKYHLTSNKNGPNLYPFMHPSTCNHQKMQNQFSCKVFSDGSRKTYATFEVKNKQSLQKTLLVDLDSKF